MKTNEVMRLGMWGNESTDTEVVLLEKLGKNEVCICVNSDNQTSSKLRVPMWWNILPKNRIFKEQIY
jgi:hypothetical protein